MLVHCEFCGKEIKYAHKGGVNRRVCRACLRSAAKVPEKKSGEMYACKVCSCPIETTIKDEWICKECFAIRQVDETAPCPTCGKASCRTRYPTETIIMECPVCGVWMPDRDALRGITLLIASIEPQVSKHAPSADKPPSFDRETPCVFYNHGSDEAFQFSKGADGYYLIWKYSEEAKDWEFVVSHLWAESALEDMQRRISE